MLSAAVGGACEKYPPLSRKSVHHRKQILIINLIKERYVHGYLKNHARFWYSRKVSQKAP